LSTKKTKLVKQAFCRKVDARKNLKDATPHTALNIEPIEIAQHIELFRFFRGQLTVFRIESFRGFSNQGFYEGYT